MATQRVPVYLLTNENQLGDVGEKIIKDTLEVQSKKRKVRGIGDEHR